ncbi:MAG: 50S ribosomal protein L17 [Flavobacteriales bacterium]|nr:50S ribosomal protein L17 [Flavobacteriales bacterium]
MRHGKKINHLGRQASHRKAMLANMACSLIEHKRINTTVAKAKALQKYIEPLITKSKTDSTHSRRVVFSYLNDKNAVTELFREVSTKVGDRPGGYTRILKTGFRLGDNAQMCFIELVDYNENMLKDSKKKTSRRRRGGKKSDDTAASAAAAPETAVEATEAETKAEVVEEAPAAEAAPEAEAKAEEAPAAEENEANKEDDSEEEKKEE